MPLHTFTVICFAIPVLSLAKTVVDTRRYLIGVEKVYREVDTAMARKKAAQVWKLRDGSEISLADMTDPHLENAIKMVARNCHKRGYLGEMTADRSFLKLVDEAKRRKFKVSILNTPIQKDGRYEYVDVWIPTPRSKLAAGFFPSDWDSRPQD